MYMTNFGQINNFLVLVLVLATFLFGAISKFQNHVLLLCHIIEVHEEKCGIQ